MVPTDHTGLAGARIWLSGAVPEGGSSAVVEFVRRFSSDVFERGGHIIHGSHPSLVPILLESAERHQANGGRKDCLTLVASRQWSKSGELPLNDWRKYALVYETPESSHLSSRSSSLDLLRKWIASRSDAVVIVGGREWGFATGRSGVPLELELAMERGLPCFVLGAFGGAAQRVSTERSNYLRHLRNGLTEEENVRLANASYAPDLSENLCGYLARLPLVRGRASDGVSFRILALDGGGLKGAFTASVLATWERQTGLRIVDHFDLIAGTSTGGILAIGLGLGLSGQEMLEFYRKRGPVIFPVTSLRSKLRHKARHLLAPKYALATLLRELESGLYQGKEALTLKQSRCRLLIPSYHVVAGASHVFRTPHHPGLTSDADMQAAHVALATAAAPTYFMAAKIANLVTESSYFDGGVWANSPAMAAVIEAVCVLGVPLDRVDVLSIGTTEQPFTARHHTRGGILQWGWKKQILELLMSVQQESSLRLARQLTGEARFRRVNVFTAPGSYSLDGATEIGELADLGYRAALDGDTLEVVRSRFLNGVFVTPWLSLG